MITAYQFAIKVSSTKQLISSYSRRLYTICQWDTFANLLCVTFGLL